MKRSCLAVAASFLVRPLRAGIGLFLGLLQLLRSSTLHANQGGRFTTGRFLSGPSDFQLRFCCELGVCLALLHEKKRSLTLRSHPQSLSTRAIPSRTLPMRFAFAAASAALAAFFRLPADRMCQVSNVYPMVPEIVPLSVSAHAASSAAALAASKG